MKPIKLSLTAFGPYKNKEVIDFTSLKPHQLFVISGATGAGKTTIFDGICFALYGAASGTDRENAMMLRSHFADDDVHTAVELIFELKDRTYRVFRQLGHVKKGNKTKTGDDYGFFEWLPDGTERPCVDRQIVTEINQEIEALIGLTQDQFKQIVMLPQGEFRKLLTSETENKEAILRRLFQTERYGQMNTILKEKKAMVQQQFVKEQEALTHHIESIHTIIGRREDSQLFSLLDQEYYHAGQVLEAMQEERIYLQEKIQIKKQLYTDALSQFEQTQTTYHKAIALNEQFDELEQKQKAFHHLTLQKEIITKKQVQLEKAKRAEQIVPYEQQVEERREEKQEKEQFFIEAEKHLQVTKDTLASAQAMYNEAESKADEREQVKQTLIRLREFLPVVKEMDEKKATLDVLEKEKTAIANDSKNLVEEITDNEDKMIEIRDWLMKNENRLLERTKKQDEIIQLREKYALLDSFIKNKVQRQKLESSLQEETMKVKQIEETYKIQEENWLQNQAVVLATHLHEGEACPVCGSSSHPKKAVGTKDAITKEMLAQTKEVVTIQQKQFHSLTAELNQVTAQMNEQISLLGEYGMVASEVTSTLVAVKERGITLKQEVKELDKLTEKVKEVRTTLGQLETALKTARQKKEQLEKTLTEKQTAFTTLEATFREQIRHIPEAMRDLHSLQANIKQQTTLQKSLEQAWQTAQTALQQADREYTTAHVHATKGKEDLEKMIHIVKQIETTFQGKLTDAHFTDEAAYIRAKLPDEQKERLQKEIDTYTQGRLTLEKQIEELSVQLQNKKRVDIDELTLQLNTLKEQYEVAFATYSKAQETVTQTDKLIETIYSVQQRVEETEKELAAITDVYDVLRGQNTKRISFERYLQIDYLEQITAAANERFKALTNGQFYLIRSDRQETHGKQSGLAIDVYDAYTGQTRDVKTLSGGEKFIASLCLALGMSDVIQSFRGGISVETMFIDEGFGSLDEESLHKAIDALVSLQQTGRMIGVISHVDELKTIFPAMLEVTKTKEGHSKTEFILK